MKRSNVILLYSIVFFVLVIATSFSPKVIFTPKESLIFALLIGLVGAIIGFITNYIINQVNKKPYNFNINELDILVFILVWGFLEILGMGDLWTHSLGLIASYLFNHIRRKIHFYDKKSVAHK